MFECLDPDELPTPPPLLLPVMVFGQTPLALLLLSDLPADLCVQDGKGPRMQFGSRGRDKLCVMSLDLGLLVCPVGMLSVSDSRSSLQNLAHS